MDNEIVGEKKKIIRQYQDSGIQVVVEIPMPDEKRDENGIRNVKRILDSELLLQICR